MRPDVPSGLVTVIAQCLEKRIDQRFQSVSALAPRLLPFAWCAGVAIDRLNPPFREVRDGRRKRSEPARALIGHSGEGLGDAGPILRVAGPIFGDPPSLETAGAPVGDTGPAWLRSAAGREPPPRSLGGFGGGSLGPPAPFGRGRRD